MALAAFCNGWCATSSVRSARFRWGVWRASRAASLSAWAVATSCSFVCWVWSLSSAESGCGAAGLQRLDLPAGLRELVLGVAQGFGKILRLLLDLACGDALDGAVEFQHLFGGNGDVRRGDAVVRGLKLIRNAAGREVIGPGSGQARRHGKLPYAVDLGRVERGEGNGGGFRRTVVHLNERGDLGDAEVVAGGERDVDRIVGADPQERLGRCDGDDRREVRPRDDGMRPLSLLVSSFPAVALASCRRYSPEWMTVKSAA